MKEVEILCSTLYSRAESLLQTKVLISTHASGSEPLSRRRRRRRHCQWITTISSFKPSELASRIMLIRSRSRRSAGESSWNVKLSC